MITLILCSSNVFAYSRIYYDDEQNIDESKAKIKKEEAVKTAKEVLSKYFNCKVDDKFDERIQLREDIYPVKTSCWHISWSNNTVNEGYNFRIRVNAENGRIISINKNVYDHNDEEAEIPIILKKDAKKKSDEFLKAYNADIYNKAKYIDYSNRYNGRDYKFTYVRYHDGFKYDSDQITIDIDSITGKITGYSEDWDYDLEFEKIDEVKKENDVKDLFYNNIEMKLTYIPIREEGSRNIKDAKLAYERDSNCYYIDAKTGKLDCSDLDKIVSKELNKEEVEELKKGRDTKKQKVSKLTISEAKKVIELYLSELTSGAKVESINYTKGNHNGINCEQYSGNFPTGGEWYESIDIDAYTGEIIRYSNYDFDDREERSKDSKTWEDCYNIAIETIAKYYPDKLSKINTKQIHNTDMNELNSCFFHFFRIVNGIQYNNDNIAIDIDENTGEILEIYNDWNPNITFQSTEKVIGSEKAKEIFFTNYKPTLIYIKGENDKKAKLVYVLANKNAKYKYYWRYNLVDAMTGKFVNYEGQDQVYSEEKQITKHWAKKELDIFQNQKYIDISKIDVNSTINYKELIKLVVKAKGYRPYRYDEVDTKLLFTNITNKSDMYPFLQFAVEEKILENKAVKIDLDKKVTREELAEIIIKAENLDSIGKLNEIYTVNELYLDADDIDKELLGYVALCNGLDIMKGNKGKFNPKKEVTYAEAVVAIYKALAK
jgi:hypothetical protein